MIALICDGSLSVAGGAGRIAASGFIDYLKLELTKAVGPLAVMLLEDVVYDLGCEVNYFPVKKVPELCSLLAEEIKRKDLATEFERNVIARFRKSQ